MAQRGTQHDSGHWVNGGVWSKDETFKPLPSSVAMTTAENVWFFMSSLCRLARVEMTPVSELMSSRWLGSCHIWYLKGINPHSCRAGTMCLPALLPGHNEHPGADKFKYFLWLVLRYVAGFQPWVREQAPGQKARSHLQSYLIF